MLSLPKHLGGIIGKAALMALPGLNEKIQVTPERNKDWDYTCPSGIKIYNMNKKTGSFGFPTCQELANAIVQNLDHENSAIEKVELKQAGAGPADKAGFFLNISLKNEFIENEIMKILHTEQLSVQNDEEEEAKKQRVVVDFSSPNIAKNMHVGHLRSTIQGDSICRVLEFLGYDVLRTNHLGDWGTQFGMLITELNDKFPNMQAEGIDMGDLQTFYQNAKKRFDEEPEFKKTSQLNVVKLQSGDEDCVKAWQYLCEVSRKEFQKIYERLDIRIEERGESFYNPLLKPLVEEMEERGFIKEDKGAKCIFIPKQKIPLMLQKSDGGFNYDTTDLAALRFRINEQGADWIIYITDCGQELHFKLVFEGGKIVGIYDPTKTRIDHMGFGLVLQESTYDYEEEKKEGQEETKEIKKEQIKEEKKEETKAAPKKKKVEKIKTREGKSTKLEALLDEAKNRALQIFKNRNEEHQLEGAEAVHKVQVEDSDLEKTAEILGISSIKYYDLKQNRIQNYVFSFDKMLDPRGNTGVYLQYMYVRVLSIMRKGNYTPDKIHELMQNDKFVITSKSERELALTLLRLPEQIDLALTDLQLNRLTELLYETAVKIGEFYQQNKVIGSQEEKSRILLLEATRKVMLQIFGLLGMKTIERI
eukprot:403336906